MKNPFSILFHPRDKPKDMVSGAPTFYFGTSGAGKSVTAQSAIQLSAVYACVRVIAETVASLPLGVYETDDTSSHKALDHPLYRLLHDEPNEEMTSFVWREVMLTHLLLWGNSYSQIIRTGRNLVTGLYPLLPDHMVVDRDSKGNLTYTYSTADGLDVKLRPDEVLHIPGLGFDGIMGYSPIALEKKRHWTGACLRGIRQQVFLQRSASLGCADPSQHRQESAGAPGKLEPRLRRLLQRQPRRNFRGGHGVQNHRHSQQ